MRDDIALGYMDEARRFKRASVILGSLAVIGWGIAIFGFINRGAGSDLSVAQRPSAPAKTEIKAAPTPKSPKSLSFTSKDPGKYDAGEWVLNIASDPIEGTRSAAIGQLFSTDDNSHVDGYSIVIRTQKTDGWNIYLSPSLGASEISALTGVQMRLDDESAITLNATPMTGGAASIGGDKLIEKMLGHKKATIRFWIGRDSEKYGLTVYVKLTQLGNLFAYQ